MNFENLTQIKKLGSGMLGTTYLVQNSVTKKKYALKIQHILPKDRKKDYKNELWRELDLYEFINKLRPNEQQFFTKLHAYEIFDKCTHDQNKQRIEPIKKECVTPLCERLKKLDKSDWCVKFLLDYHGKSTLGKYLATHSMNVRQMYSIILQICLIHSVLYKGGYSHGDLHMNNIMVSPTSQSHFEFMNTKVSFFGLKIISIDYGEVRHAKFKNKIDPWAQLFLTNRKKFLFDETFGSISIIVQNFDKYIYNCDKKKMKMPYYEGGPDPFDATIQNILEIILTFLWNIKTNI